MKKLLCILLCVTSLAACKKEYDPGVRPLTGWRQPDCSAAAGEGIYEAFNDSETKYLVTRPFPGAEEIYDSAVVTGISLTSRTVLSSGVNNAFLEYKANGPVELRLVLLLNNGDDNMGISGQVVNVVTPEKTRFNLVNIEKNGKTGCHRLYYVFTQMINARPGIVNKGHFDIVLQ